MFLLPLSPSLLLFIHPTALPFPRTRVFLPRIPYLPFVRGICSFNPSEGTRGIDEGEEGGIDNGMQIIFKRWQPRFRLCFFIPSRIFRGEVKHVEWSTEFKKKCYPYKKIAHIPNIRTYIRIRAQSDSHLLVEKLQRTKEKSRWENTRISITKYLLLHTSSSSSLPSMADTRVIPDFAR